MNNFDAITEKLSGKKILITGATGFVGKNLCELLVGLNSKLKYKIEITGLARNPVLFPGVKFLQHDMLNPLDFDFDFDFIIHAATPVVKVEESDQKTLDIIVKGTQNILEFAKKSNCSNFLFISSGSVYGDISESLGLIPETYHPASPLKSAYAIGKELSESMCLEFQKNNKIILNIARCFAFSGKYLPLNAHFALGNFIRDALAGRSIHIKGDGSAIRSYMDADDMVYWLLTILLHDKNDIFNVGSDQGISIKDLAFKVASLYSGLDVIIEGESSESLKKNIYVPSISKAWDILGLKLETSIESSLKKMIEFNRA